MGPFTEWLVHMFVVVLLLVVWDRVEQLHAKIRALTEGEKK